MYPLSFKYTKFMVKNIIFDIGNVLATFKPKDFLTDLFKDPTLVDQFFEVFFTKLWHEYDQGLYTKEQMVQKGLQKMPDQKEKINKMMDVWTSYVVGIQENLDLIRIYQKKGYKVFILSNLPEDSYIYLKEHYDFIDQVDGGIYSYQHKLIKPDVKIFEALLEKYGLNANECIFIDDTEVNIRAAETLGFYTIWLKDHTQLATLLKENLNEV